MAVNGVGTVGPPPAPPNQPKKQKKNREVRFILLDYYDSKKKLTSMHRLILFISFALLFVYCVSSNTCADCKTIVIPTEDVPGCTKYDWVETDSQGVPITSLVANSIGIDASAGKGNSNYLLFSAATAGSLAVLLGGGAVVCVAAIGFALICAAISIVGTLGFCFVFKSAKKASNKPEKYFTVDENKQQNLIEAQQQEAAQAPVTEVGAADDAELSDGADD